MIPPKYWSPTKKLMVLGAMAGGKLVEDTATGNPLTFITDVSKPLKSLLVPFLPVQSGSGDPSPENIRPIVAWDGVKVWNGGKNVFDGELEKGSLDNSGNNSPSSANVRCKNYIPVVPGAAYYVKYKTTPGASNMKLYYYGADKTYINSFWKTSSTSTIPDNVYFVRFYMDTAYTFGTDRDIAINYPATETDYEPPTITETDISFPSPVYGGTLDVVSGELWKNYSLVDLGSFNYQIEQTADNHQYFTVYYSIPDAKIVDNNTISSYRCGIYKTVKATEIYFGTSGDCSISMVDSNPAGIRIRDDRFNTASELKTALAGVMLAYELISPVLIGTVTPEQITALKGNNTIWSDANGNLEVTYLKKQ